MDDTAVLLHSFMDGHSKGIMKLMCGTAFERVERAIIALRKGVTSK